MATSASTSGEWLKGALQELRERKGSSLEFDSDLISGLVSFCELAPPSDATSYLEVRSPVSIHLDGVCIGRLLLWRGESDRSWSRVLVRSDRWLVCRSGIRVCSI
jgi:hypothetical protein